MSSADRVLVCDDDARSVCALQVVLRDAGFRVVACASADDALDAAALRMPAAAIVELTVPDADGVALVRKLREWSAIPVVVLSAIHDEHHVVRALNAGADDYVTKPFAPRELIARLHATMRRARSDALEPLIEVDGLAVDLARRAVYRDGEEVHLTPIEFTLLGALLRHRGRLLTHEALLHQVWGPGHAYDTPTLRTHIANLRRKLASPPIRTMHGVGYRFDSPHPRPVPIAGSAGRRDAADQLRAA